jgi:WD40 repeat protein
VNVWRSAAGGALIRQEDIASNRAMAFSPDSSKFATGDRSGAVSIWNVRSGSRLWRSEERGRTVESLALSPDGRYLASAGGGLALRDAETGTLLFQKEGDWDDVIFSSNGVWWHTVNRVQQSTWLVRHL